MRLIADVHERLDRFLATRMPKHSRTRIVRLIEEGGVTVDGEQRKASFALKPGMEIDCAEVETTPMHDLTPVAVPIDVLYEDEWLLVVDKPRGMASHPAPGLRQATLVNALLALSHELSVEGGAFRPGIVHRLDKDTTGVMVVAKTDAVHRHLQDQIRRKTAERRYVALAWGEVEHDRFTVNAAIARNPRKRIQMMVDREGREATTHFKSLGAFEGAALLAAKLETGRTHQVRVHLAWLGHPVRGDSVYATGEWAKGALQLHAAYLSFDHPVTGERIAVYQPPPRDFSARDRVSRAVLEEW